MQHIDDMRTTISLSEAARLLGVSKATAQKAAAAGEIPALKVSGRVVVSRERLMKMIEGEQPAPIDAKAVAKEIRIMELQAQIKNAERELAELTAPQRESYGTFRRGRRGA